MVPFTPGVVDSIGGGGGRLIQLERAINDLRAAITSGDLRTEIEGAANVNIVVTDGRVAATASSSGSIEANLANSGIGVDALTLAT